MTGKIPERPKAKIDPNAGIFLGSEGQQISYAIQRTEERKLKDAKLLIDAAAEEPDVFDVPPTLIDVEPIEPKIIDVNFINSKE